MRFELSILLPLLATIAALAAWEISNIESLVKDDLEKSLKAALETSHDGIERLYESQRRGAQVLASEYWLNLKVDELLDTPPTKDALINSPAQAELRSFMKPILDTLGYLGFFIISVDGLNLASTRDENIGDINLLAGGDFLDRIYAGETLISLPLLSDVPLPSSATGEEEPDVATMFSATPIRGVDGTINAMLAVRLDPYLSLSKTFEIGRFGETGETYAFNRSGTLISQSRFEEQLVKMGLLPAAETSVLHIEIRDPGVDLSSAETAALPRELRPLTKMAKSAVIGNSGNNLDGYRDYRGVSVVGAWIWDDILGFGIATEVNSEEAFTTFANMRFAVITFALVSAGVLLLLAVIFSFNKRQIARRDRRNKLILSSVGQGIYGVDRQGNATFVNREGCLMLGYTEEEFLGKPMHELIHHSYPDGSHFPRDECHMYNSFISGTTHNIDDEVLWHKDGSAIPVSYTSRPIIKDGENISGAVVTFTDISQRKQAEIEQERLQEELSEARKLESLGHLSAGIAHEINTPCQYVSDNMSFMAEAVAKIEPLLQLVHKLLVEAGENGNQIGADDMEHIQKLYEDADIDYLLGEATMSIGQSQSGMDRIKRIVLAMKAFSHPGDERVLLDLNEAVANTLIVASSEWKDHAKLVTDYDESLPMISCIPSAINQAVLNIVVNAAHAIADDAKAGEWGEITVSTTIEAGQAIIKISDTGPGMPEDIRKKIFDPFFTTKEVGKGTGQGLVLAYKAICKDHNGSIEVDSILGKGSCFTISLPINQSAANNEEIAEEHAA